MSENVLGGFHSITDLYWTAAEFLRLAESGTPPTRYWALRRLDDLGLEIPVEVLRGCLRDPDDILSGGAAVLIGKRGVSALADALLDRLVHSAYRLELTGKSMRDPKNPPSDKET